ncbi:NUDIX domain-containing protein [Salinibacterium sp. G-O1]|uniref:NUDIX hydrolase n=1 Tax=Salinibacterium sp. G-O1 TaxID=3046208 RepID=UPI0024BA4ABC|nr:NUDIX domain-containing protein [Salinibacterium sp. G-O1]MDJ0333676.1 NUDIX domain-containing protein [Salinibacterium sp. G-O1]
MDIRVAAYGVIIVDGSILLTHWHEGRKWSLPGGGVQDREQPADAAIREIREESGFTATLGPLLSADSIIISRHAPPGVAPSPMHSFRIVYEATIASGTLTHERDGSSDEARWFALDEVQSLPRVSLVDIGISAWQESRSREQGALPG